jgi:hypothetical protein
MPDAVYQVMTMLCRLVAPLPIGTNLGLLHLLWMLVSGRLLGSRGARFAGLSDCGLPDRAVRRAWAALGQGGWTSGGLLARWAGAVQAAGEWQPCRHGGYRPVAVDLTGFWRPRLRGCPTVHYHGAAGKALPAIPLGLIAGVGRVGAQRLAVPRAFVRADVADPRPGTHERLLVRAAVRQCAADEALVLDGGFGVALLQEAGATRGTVVRPLPRAYKGKPLPATPPDQVATWQEDGTLLRAEVWGELVRADADAASPTLTAIAIHDPRHREPLLLVTPLALTPQQARDCYRDRWPVEQLPLAAKQMLGASRQFVHAPETCQRLPELALLAGAVLSYAAATAPALPTGFWDRQPRPTPGRLRRALARLPFPQDFPLPARLREKASVTTHLPTGSWGQRRPHATEPHAATAPATLRMAA